MDPTTSNNKTNIGSTFTNRLSKAFNDCNVALMDVRRVMYILCFLIILLLIILIAGWSNVLLYIDILLVIAAAGYGTLIVSRSGCFRVGA
jgi:hypothetical protein